MQIIPDKTKLQDSRGQGRFIERADDRPPRSSFNEFNQDSLRKKDNSPNYRDSPQARDSSNYRDSRQTRDIDLTKSRRDIDLRKSQPSPRSGGTLGELASKPRQPRGLPGLPSITEPQKDMVPYIPGLPIYGTPDEPASPTDCNRWPKSPYCLFTEEPDIGDFPIGMPKLPKPFGVDVEIVVDNCNIGVALTPVIAFIPMPTHQIVARSNAPECQSPPPEPPPPPPDQPVVTEEEFSLGDCDNWRIVFNPNSYEIPDYRFIDSANNKWGVLSTGSFVLATIDSPDDLAGVSMVLRTSTLNGQTSKSAFLRIAKVLRTVTIRTMYFGTANSYLGYYNGRLEPNTDDTCYWNKDRTFALGRKLRTLPIDILLEGAQLDNVYPTPDSPTAKDPIPHWFSASCLADSSVTPQPRSKPRHPPRPPWQPPPPPEPPKKPEECEPCMCCGNDDSLAMMAMLQQQLTAIQQQLAGLTHQPDPNNPNPNPDSPCQFAGFSPVLNELAAVRSDLITIDSKLNLTTKKSDFQPMVEKLPLLADKDDTNYIKEKLDNLDVDVDLTPVLEKLENIDEDVAQLSGNLGVFPGAFNDGDGGELIFDNHAELVYEVYKALDRKFSLMSEKQGNLAALIGEPLEIELYDDDLSQVGTQAKAVTPQTLFESIAFSTTRGEIALKGIGVEQYPIKYKAGEEEKEINNLSALTWAIAKAIPVDIFPRVVKWKDKDGKEYELKFENLSDIIFKLIGIPKEVILFDENTEKEGKQPKLLMPMSLFEIIALNFSRTEILAEVIGVDMFPISLKPKWEGGLPGLDDRMTMDEMLELVVSGLSVLDPVSWIIDFQETFAQVPSFLTNFLKLHVNYTVPIAPFIDMIKDFVTKEEENQLHNLVELVNFTRELVIEAKDDDGFPIVVEKEQIGGTEDLLFHTQADAIEEIVTLLCNLLTTNGYQTDIGLKCLAESVHAKAISAMVQGEVRNIADFLDYPTNAVVRPLKIHINCPAKELADGDVDLDGAEDLDKFLKESEIDITFDEWTGKKSMMDMMRDLLNQAASARGDATRRIGG